MFNQMKISSFKITPFSIFATYGICLSDNCFLKYLLLPASNIFFEIARIKEERLCGPLISGDETYIFIEVM